MPTELDIENLLVASCSKYLFCRSDQEDNALGFFQRTYADKHYETEENPFKYNDEDDFLSLSKRPLVFLCTAT